MSFPSLSSLLGGSHFRVRFYSGGCWMRCGPIGEVRGEEGAWGAEMEAMISTICIVASH